MTNQIRHFKRPYLNSRWPHTLQGRDPRVEITALNLINHQTNIGFFGVFLLDDCHHRFDWQLSSSSLSALSYPHSSRQCIHFTSYLSKNIITIHQPHILLLCFGLSLQPVLMLCPQRISLFKYHLFFSLVKNPTAAGIKCYFEAPVKKNLFRFHRKDLDLTFEILKVVGTFLSELQIKKYIFLSHFRCELKVSAGSK